MNLQSSTLKFDESGKPFHIQQAEQIRAYKDAWKKAGHQREARVSVSRSIFALVTEQDRYYFGQRGKSADSFGYIEPEKRAVFGKSYAAEPDQLIKELAQDEAMRLPPDEIGHTGRDCLLGEQIMREAGQRTRDQDH